VVARWILFLCLLTIALHVVADEHSAAVKYQTKYLTEGRDNLSGGGLATLEYVYDAPLSFVVWHAEAPGASYDESQVSLIATLPFSDTIDASVGWTAVSASSFGLRDDDHELSVTLTVSSGPWALQADGIWSHQEAGAWLALEQSYAMDHWTPGTTAFLGIGANYGYVGGESSGLNHVIAGLRGSVQPMTALSFEWDLAHTHAVRRRQGDTTINGSWGSVGLRYVF
jgi:hypothetical protein